MKKQLIPLFVMSIISLLISVAALGFGIWAITAGEALSDAASDSDDGIVALFAIFGSVMIVLLVVIMLVAFGVMALLGAFGITCAVKNGQFSLVCLVLGSVCTLFSLAGFPGFIESITNTIDPSYLLPFVYSASYTCCAIVAFMYRKKVVHDQIMETPYIPADEV